MPSLHVGAFLRPYDQSKRARALTMVLAPHRGQATSLSKSFIKSGLDKPITSLYNVFCRRVRPDPVGAFVLYRRHLAAVFVLVLSPNASYPLFAKNRGCVVSTGYGWRWHILP